MPYADPEKRRAYGRAWMKRNPEKARAGMRRWRRRHPDLHAAQTRARYARDPKRFQERIDASPNRRAVRRAMHQRRRARILGAGPHFTAAEWTALVELTETGAHMTAPQRHCTPITAYRWSAAGRTRSQTSCRRACAAIYAST